MMENNTSGKKRFKEYFLEFMMVFIAVSLGFFAEQVDLVYYTIFGVVVFIGQRILSTVCFRFFTYRPFEWAWPSATSKKFQSMNRTNPSQS